MNIALTMLEVVPWGGGIKGIIISFILLVIVLGVMAGLIYLIEQWFHTIPDTIKLIIALILVALVILWGVTVFMPGS